MNKEKQIKDIQILKEFIHFLKEHNAYIEFRDSIAMATIECSNKVSLVQAFTYPLQIKLNMFKRVNEKQRMIFNEKIIDKSFIWCKTPQGADFWFNLHEKWKTLYNNRKHETN